MFAKIIDNTGVKLIGERQLLIRHDVPSKVPRIMSNSGNETIANAPKEHAKMGR